MNPKHLMLGNYILYNGKEVIVTPQLLTTMQNPCKCKLFSPIELTEQWLIDFKIDEVEKHIYRIDLMYNNCLFINMAHKVCVIGFPDCDSEDKELIFPNYVHKLQNIIWALTDKNVFLK